MTEGDVQSRQDALIEKLWKQVQPTFSKLLPFVSFAMAKTVDFASLEQQARASVQSVKDQSGSLVDELTKQREAAQEILKDVRKAAAEQGVSQQAVYLKEEADKHADLTENWRWWTIRAIAVGLRLG